MANENINSMRIYDFNTLMKSMKTQDVSNIKNYSIPLEKMPKVKDQQDYCCCVACALSSVLEFFNQVETGKYKELSISYIYGKHRPKDSNSSGMFVETAIKCLLEKGSVPVEFFPKLMEMPEVKKELQNRDDLDKIAIPYKIQGYCKINGQNIDDLYKKVKLALINYNTPIVAWSNRGFAENHCFIIYGVEFKNNMPYVLFQNSYGENYGKNGRASLPLADVKDMYLLFDEQVKLPFEDVPENAWFYKNVLHMYSAGLISGKSETEFKPNDYITRAEVCSILDRMLSKLDENNLSQFTSLENRLQNIENKLFFS